MFEINTPGRFRRKDFISNDTLPRLHVPRLIKIVYARLPEEHKLKFLEDMDIFLSKYYNLAKMKPISPTLANRYKLIARSGGIYGQ